MVAVPLSVLTSTSLAPPALAAIAMRGMATSVSYPSSSTTAFTLTTPSGTVAGDVVLASIGLGVTGAASQVTLTPPSGWTLVQRTNHGSSDALAVFAHTFVTGETSYSFATGVAVGGIGVLSAWSGVDTDNPVNAMAGLDASGSTTTVSAPSIMTTTTNTLLVANYYAYRGGAAGTVWTAPGGMTLARTVTNGSSRSGSVSSVVQAAAGASGAKTATASVSQDFADAILIALRPTVVASGPVPLIIDTDLFSDADDVGALATAFGLQLLNEAKIVAIGVNTRLSRPSVATTSWKCAAAIAQWYGMPTIPIGTDMPNNGTAVNTADFATPCAARAAPATPTPLSAVSVFRQALVGQPNSSVVIVEAGYQENLTALLASPADGISALTGSALIAQKVKMLVVVGGGYPSRAGENNLVGNPAAAQTVATTWPTKIVWSGYEVGNVVNTGNTISAVHPTTSPVRISYEAFVGPNNYIPSWDLTAVYHAVRFGDLKLTQVGPGTNTITGAGANTFTAGAGNQYYLSLTNTTALNAAIESVLDQLPPTPGPTDDFSSNTIDPAKWTILNSGSTVAAASQQLQITHPAGPWTSSSLRSVAAFNATGKTTRVQVIRAANSGVGGATFGETTVLLRVDATHYVQFFIAGSSLTAWVNTGAGVVNQTPAYPAYTAATMQWLRFRESAGTLFWEYAAGATTPGPWTTLFSMANPINVAAVRLELDAGANVAATDIATFDNIVTA